MTDGAGGAEVQTTDETETETDPLPAAEAEDLPGHADNSPDDDNASGQAATPPEEDVFEVDLVPLTDSQQDTAAGTREEAGDPNVPDLNLSYNTKVTADGKLILEPVFGPVSNLNADKMMKQAASSMRDKQLIATESSIQTLGNKKIKRTRRLYHLPLGQKIELGTFVKQMPDGRKMRIIRRQHHPKPPEKVH